MRTKTLGRTGIELPIVGLGAANLGLPTQASAYFQHVENPEHVSLANMDIAIATVHSALENGVKLVDTAPKYCYGDSERAIYRALNGYPELISKTLVTTKVGLIYEGDGFNYSYGAAMRCVRRSMERLGMNHFPVLYLHDPMGFPMDFVMGSAGAMGALRNLRRQGVVDYIGIAADEPGTAADYIETGEFDVATVSGAWSLVNQKANERILPAARRHNVGIVATTVIERGLLATGKPLSGVKYVQRDFTPELLEHVEKINSLCQKFGVSLLAVALQWAVREPQVTVVVPGARNPEEARINARAGSEKIPEAFWEKLQPLVKHFDTRV